MKRNVSVLIAVVLVATVAQRERRLGTTPQTFVLDSAGRMILHWRGAFAGETADSIEKYFNLALPEVDTRRAVE